ncbi:lysis protein [Pseudomonas sp. NKUCC02_KPG]|nr:lysis protein [Pseudomonas sp. NKUCC02_KPG]
MANIIPTGAFGTDTTPAAEAVKPFPHLLIIQPLKPQSQTERTNLANANSAQILAEQGKRLALEQWLAASDQAHYRALTDEKTKQARLRDRLATADLRLSVQLDAAAIGCDAVQATTSPGGVVYGARRAQLDSAHAQRIIGITGDGDQGLIALQACQAYVKEISALK